MKKKKELPACPVATSVSLIGDKWKLLIIRNLKSRTLRFNELQRDLDGISQKVITETLPPTFRSSILDLSAIFNTSNSLFTSILIA